MNFMRNRNTHVAGFFCLFLTGFYALSLVPSSSVLAPLAQTVVPPASALELGRLNPVDRPVPAFAMNDLDSTVWNPAKLKNKITIVNFWASWCAPCREEMPSLNRAWEKVRDDGVQMLAINIGDTESTIQSFLAEVPIDFTVLRSTDAKDLANWGVRGLPTTLVVDGDANVVLELVGPAEWDQDELLQPVLDLL